MSRHSCFGPVPNKLLDHLAAGVQVHFWTDDQRLAFVTLVDRYPMASCRGVTPEDQMAWVH